MPSKLAVLLCLCAVVTALPKRLPRIAGGEDAKPGQYPYYVALYYKDTIDTVRPVSFGGGAILNKQWILTAAYCANSVEEVDEMIVEAGNIYYEKSSDTQQRSNVVARLIHPKYTETNYPYDLALLKLETPLEFNDSVAPIDLPQAGAIPSGAGTVTGLGSLKYIMAPVFPDTLQTVNMPIIDNETCDKLLDKQLGESKEAYHLLDETRFCTVATKTDQGYTGYCLHDTGDPIVVDNKLVGVATLGFSAICDITDTPSVFTRVSAFNDWIQETISKN